MERPVCDARRPLIAVASAWVRLMSRYVPSTAAPTALAQHVQEVLNHLVRGGDDPGIGRVGLLGHDQLSEFVGDVGVGALERGADDLARRTQDGGAGLVGDLEGA